MNEYTSGYIKVVLGSGEPGTPNWRNAAEVVVDEQTVDYVRRRMGKREIDREVLAETARWVQEMDQILSEEENSEIDEMMRELDEMELEEEMEDFLQLLPEEVC